MATGQEAARPATPADLARAYIRFERALRSADPKGPALRSMNERFDRITRLFLNNRFEHAAQSLDEMTLQLNREVPGARMAPELLALRATISPAVRARTSTDRVLLEIVGTQPIDAQRMNLRAELAAPSGGVLWRSDINTLPFRTELTEAAGEAPTGRYELRAARGDGDWVSLGELTVLDQPLGDMRRRLAGRMQLLDPQDDSLRRDVEICADRIALLIIDPDSSSIGAFTRNLPQLADSIASEISRLEAGESPYQSRTGDYARHLRSNGLTIPLRLYVPKCIADEPHAPRPLLVALHGASVDENMFFDGYGAGLIKDLAEERGFIVAAPLTYFFSGSPDHFDALIGDLSRHYQIDRSRLLVLGHSLGAIGALSLADWRSESLAASCCIAGFRPLGAPESMCPTRIYIAEHDYTIFQPDRVLPIINGAIDAGLPLDPVVMPDQGHTLIVASVLPDAIDWLLGHRTRQPDAPLGE